MDCYAKGEVVEFIKPGGNKEMKNDEGGGLSASLKGWAVRRPKNT